MKQNVPETLTDCVTLILQRLPFGEFNCPDTGTNVKVHKVEYNDIYDVISCGSLVAKFVSGKWFIEKPNVDKHDICQVPLLVKLEEAFQVEWIII